MIPVLFEDEDILIVSKPAGLLSQGTRDPSRTHLIRELIEKQNYKNLYLHHRLDKDTSGVILLSKSSRVNARLTEIFREHHVKKVYWALAKPGPPFSASEFSVKLHMAPVKGPRGVERMVVVKSGGWFSHTNFRVLAEASGAPGGADGPAVVECSPVTGRTHQIRVHLGHLKRPILGDRTYGGKSTEVPRLMLHARSLEFAHPWSGQPLRIESPLPADFKGVLRNFGFPENLS